MVTDSSACIPAAWAARFGIAVVPLRVHLGDLTLSDAESAAREAVYRALAAGEAVKSSAPPPSDYLAAVDGADADEVVVITPPVEFTAMARSASVAARLAERPCHVVDCRAVAAGQALVVVEAARAASLGASAEEVLEVTERLSRRCQLMAALPGVGTLGRSGRIPPATVQKARHADGNGLSVFRVWAAHIELVASCDTEEEALECMTAAWRADGGSPTMPSAVFHAINDGGAAALARRTGSELVTEFSPAMGLHTGPGVVGLAWLAGGS